LAGMGIPFRPAGLSWAFNGGPESEQVRRPLKTLPNIEDAGNKVGFQQKKTTLPLGSTHFRIGREKKTGPAPETFVRGWGGLVPRGGPRNEKDRFDYKTDSQLSPVVRLLGGKTRAQTGRQPKIGGPAASGKKHLWSWVEGKSGEPWGKVYAWQG